jgi:hypothetical protein
MLIIVLKSSDHEHEHDHEHELNGRTRRQIHFHWRRGSMMADGLSGEHSTKILVRDGKLAE